MHNWLLQVPACSLRHDELVLVLQHVPLDHRLKHCAAVCRSWHSAACVATKEVNVEWSRQEHCDALHAWLLQYPSTAAAVQSLSLSGYLETDKPCYTRSWLPLQLQLPVGLLQQLSTLSLTHLEVKPHALSTGERMQQQQHAWGTLQQQASSNPAAASAVSCGSSQQAQELAAQQLQQLQLLQDEQQQQLHMLVQASGGSAATGPAYSSSQQAQDLTMQQLQQLLLLQLVQSQQVAQREQQQQEQGNMVTQGTTSFSSLPALKNLSIVSCSVDLADLSAATALVQLTLGALHPESASQESATNAAVEGALQSLTQLT